MTSRLSVVMLVAALLSCGAVVTALGGVDESRTAAAAAPAASAADDETAASFVRHVVRLIAENRYDEAWPLLHPSHRRAAARSDYVACERRSPIPGRVLAVRTGSAFDESVLLGTERTVSSRAVPVRVVLLDLATMEETVVRDTVHAVRVGGRWTWVLPPERLAGYRAGTCPGAPPPLPGQT